jgi:tRNA nucleotidyltransferase (CCA-adding enzyme)
MREILPQNLILLSQKTPKPLYLVGGAVRNYLAALPPSEDYDLCGAMTAEEVSLAAQAVGLKTVAVYPRTHTARIADGKRVYEFTSFRTESYEEGGAHTPVSVAFTQSLAEDATRRDFACNAVYYDVALGRFEDPLGGIADIKKGIIRAANAQRVFRSDGLRLMRLARFAGELHFSPEAETLAAARRFAANIDDISTERVVEELRKILLCDTKYPESGADAPVRALKLLHEIRVLERIFPFVKAADGLAQRPDFHDHDVLNHTLYAVQYIAPDITLRLAALLHDAGKPVAYEKSGNMHYHEVYSEELAQTLLSRYNFGNKTKATVSRLCRAHMFDTSGTARQITRRKFILRNQDIFEELCALMQADFSACKNDLSLAPTVKRLREERENMVRLGVPFSPSELALSATQLTDLGFAGKKIGDALTFLWEECVLHPESNSPEKLLKLARRRLERMK